MNKTFDEPDDDVHRSNGEGCRRCGTAEEEMVERRKGRMKKRHIGEKRGGESGRKRTGSKGGDGGRGKPARKKLGVIYNNRKRKRRRSRLDS